MQPMQAFDPNRPSRAHDALNDITFVWRTAWADNWRRCAWVASDGLAYWDGLILDGWNPLSFEDKARTRAGRRFCPMPARDAQTP